MACGQVRSILQRGRLILGITQPLTRHPLGATGSQATHKSLLELEASGWRDLFGTAFGFEWLDQSLSLVVQDGVTWLVFSSNNISDDGDPVFTVSVFGEVTYFGEVEERFDWAIQNPVPLVFRRELASEAGMSADLQ